MWGFQAYSGGTEQAKAARAWRLEEDSVHKTAMDGLSLQCTSPQSGRDEEAKGGSDAAGMAALGSVL